MAPIASTRAASAEDHAQPSTLLRLTRYAVSSVERFAISSTSAHELVAVREMLAALVERVDARVREIDGRRTAGAGLDGRRERT